MTTNSGTAMPKLSGAQHGIRVTDDDNDDNEMTDERVAA
jgi:hypothetical protein